MIFSFFYFLQQKKFQNDQIAISLNGSQIQYLNKSSLGTVFSDFLLSVKIGVEIVWIKAGVMWLSNMSSYAFFRVM